MHIYIFGSLKVSAGDTRILMIAECLRSSLFLQLLRVAVALKLKLGLERADFIPKSLHFLRFRDVSETNNSSRKHDLKVAFDSIQTVNASLLTLYPWLPRPNNNT